MKNQFIKIVTSLLLLCIFMISTIASSKAIKVEVVQTEEIPKLEYINAVGTLLPYEKVTISPELSGKIVSVNFEEGGIVKKDQLLIKFDNRLAAAKKKNAEANLINAEQNLQRLEASKGGASAQQIDAARTMKLQAEADLEIAEVELDRTLLTAPFDGTMGLINQYAGSYIQTGSNLTTIVNTSKLKLEFNLPERIAHTVKANQQLQFSVDNFPKKKFTAEVYALSPEIEQEGRSLIVKALYDNQDNALLPGMFSRISLEIPMGYNVIVVPEEAVFSSEGKQFVYRVVEEDGKLVAKLTEIILGERLSFAVEIIHGLQKGNKVVSAGQARLRDNSVIEPINI